MVSAIECSSTERAIIDNGGERYAKQLAAYKETKY